MLQILVWCPSSWRVLIWILWFDTSWFIHDFIKDFNDFFYHQSASFRLDNVKFLKSISTKCVQVYIVLAKHYKLYFFFRKEMCIFYTRLFSQLFYSSVYSMYTLVFAAELYCFLTVWTCASLCDGPWILTSHNQCVCKLH